MNTVDRKVRSVSAAIGSDQKVQTYRARTADRSGSLLTSRTCDSGFRMGRRRSTPGRAVAHGCTATRGARRFREGQRIGARPRQVEFFGSARGIYNRGNGG